MTGLDGKVAIITGAGRGLGREHALLFASMGARVVVNDLGSGGDGEGASSTPADEVVDEIKSMGGEALANADDVADWQGGKNLIAAAAERFGTVDVLVNNAGILRDRMLVNMTEDDWDKVMRVHLRGHFVPTRWAAEYWRDRVKAGERTAAAVVNTGSPSGLLINPGQANYGTAKAGIAALTQIAATELGRYGVRVNAVTPSARTRLTAATPGMEEIVKAPTDPDAFDEWNPANVSPLVAFLASDECTITGGVYFIHGSRIQRFEPWRVSEPVDIGRRWTVEELADNEGRFDPGPPTLLATLA